MGGIQPQDLFISPLLLNPPMIESILENELSLDPNNVVSWDWYVGIFVAAYQKVGVC